MIYIRQPKRQTLLYKGQNDEKSTKSIKNHTFGVYIYTVAEHHTRTSKIPYFYRVQMHPVADPEKNKSKIIQKTAPRHHLTLPWLVFRTQWKNDNDFHSNRSYKTPWRKPYENQ